MLNTNGLDGPRGFGTQYSQQQQNAGFPLGALAGGMQNANRGTLGGLQTNQSAQQAQQRFQGQAQLQPGLQQLNQYQARPMANGVGMLANNPAAAAGARAGMGMGNTNPAQIRPVGVDGRSLANVGLGNPGQGQPGWNMQGYGQNPLAAALGNQQAVNLGMNKLGNPGMNNVQNAQNARLGLTSTAALGDSDFPPLENASDFPSLGGNPQQAQAGAGVVPGDLYAGLRKAVAAASLGGNNLEFSMQADDFPALPGAPTARQSDGRGGPAQQRGGFPMLTGNDQFNEQGGQGQNYDQIMQYQQQQMQGDRGTVKSGPDKSLGASSAPDRFGLLGLMPLLKMSDPHLTMLALGTDLTSLGLNLNSSESLHKTFVSPMSDAPVKPEPELDLPACYKHNPQRLQPGYLTKFKEETLFYMFYSMPQNETQLIAADELSSRGWWFHKRYQLWMIHAPNTAMQKIQRGERGSYLVFDPAVWEVVPKGDLEILYDDVEQPPRLPRPKHLQTQR
eukprot:gene30688-35715_t